MTFRTVVRLHRFGIQAIAALMSQVLFRGFRNGLTLQLTCVASDLREIRHIGARFNIVIVIAVRSLQISMCLAVEDSKSYW